MPLIVQKFGGTSVGTLERIGAVADRVVATRARYDRVIVVVSAMAHTTDELLALARGLTPRPNRRELDMLLTAGERIAMALTAIALEARGVRAISFTGSQVGIITDGIHTNARILEIKGARIDQSLRDGVVVVVAGFQGFGTHREITTLGRGGSDTTAVALAAHLHADRCEIYTDVDGLYDADPRRVKGARLLAQCGYEEVIEMAYAGAQVLHPRAVEIAWRYRVPLTVRSSFSDQPGTTIGGRNMERVIIRAVADNTRVVKVALVGVPNQPGVVARIFQVLSAANVSIPMVVQSQNYKGKNDVAFVVREDDWAGIEDALETLRADLSARAVVADRSVATVSVIGEGIASSPHVMHRVFALLHELGVNIDMISSSAISLTVVVPRGQAAAALAHLHEHLDLEQPLAD